MIGVVGDDRTADHVASRLRDAGEPLVADEAEAVVDENPTAIVAVGEAALVDLVWAGVEVPVLAVDSGPGFPAVSGDDAPAVAAGLGDRDLETSTHGLLSVVADGEPVGPAGLDVLLVRAEPGRISEYGLAAGETAARFRADGVVVATPAGSHGYSDAAGGPRLALDAAAMAVVPVAPFGLGAPSWVFDSDGSVELTVERDTGEVAVLLDGRERRRLAGRSAVSIRFQGVLRTVEPTSH